MTPPPDDDEEWGAWYLAQDIEEWGPAVDKREAEVAAQCFKEGICPMCQAEVDVLGRTLDGELRTPRRYTLVDAEGKLYCASHDPVSQDLQGNMFGGGRDVPLRKLTPEELALLASPPNGLTA